MKLTTMIAATFGAVLLTGCATTGLTFDALDKDADGFAKIADVASADKVGTVQSVSAFDTNSDAKLSATEFQAYLASPQRTAALNALAKQEAAERAARSQYDRTIPSAATSGSYGS